MVDAGLLPVLLGKDCLVVSVANFLNQITDQDMKPPVPQRATVRTAAKPVVCVQDLGPVYMAILQLMSLIHQENLRRQEIEQDTIFHFKLNKAKYNHHRNVLQSAIYKKIV